MSTRLAVSAPTTAPTVFAAYVAPTSAAGSASLDRADASASGKLAPHRIAAGSTAHNARSRSSSKVNHAFVEIVGAIGQYGSDRFSDLAVHAIAATIAS